MKMSKKLNILKNKVYKKLVDFFFRCIRNLNDKIEKNPRNISIGDVYWCEMPLPSFELYRVPVGHRIRPYIVLDIKDKGIIAYACSSHTRATRKRDYYCIDSLKYSTEKDSYVDKTRTWEIPFQKVIQYYYTLDDEDLNVLLVGQSDGCYKYLKREIGVGSVIKDGNEDKFYICEIEKDYLLAYKIYENYDLETNKENRIFIYDGNKYYIDKTDKMKRISVNEHIRRIAQLGVGEMYRVSKSIDNETDSSDKEKSGNKSLSVLSYGACQNYPVGTVFWESYSDQYFIYLFTRKNKSYGIYEEDWADDNSQIKKISMKYVSKMGILEQKDFNDLIESIQRRFKDEKVINYLCSTYTEPKPEDALYRS